VKKKHDDKNQDASAEVDGSTEKKIWKVYPDTSES
jgi:hypothetical protein